MNHTDNAKAICPYYGSTSRQNKTVNADTYWVSCNGVCGEYIQTKVLFENRESFEEHIEKYCFSDYGKCPELKKQTEINPFPCKMCKTKEPDKCAGYHYCMKWRNWFSSEWGSITKRLRRNADNE